MKSVVYRYYAVLRARPWTGLFLCLAVLDVVRALTGAPEPSARLASASVMLLAATVALDRDQTARLEKRLDAYAQIIAALCERTKRRPSPDENPEGVSRG